MSSHRLLTPREGGLSALGIRACDLFRIAGLRRHHTRCDTEAKRATTSASKATSFGFEIDSARGAVSRVDDPREVMPRL